MSRPSDYIDAGRTDVPDVSAPIDNPRIGVGGWWRWIWRQLTNMRTALILLLLLAIAAVPGSLVPQRSSDPNGVTQYFSDNPDLAPVLDSFGFFDVYSSAWFSAIYILLFVSLIGCVVPRIMHHARALRSRPPATPARLERLDDCVDRAAPEGVSAADIISVAGNQLRAAGYRVETYDKDALSVSAERGYMRETGNLVFHLALVGVLIAVAVGGSAGFAGQRVVVEGQSFVNTLASYDSFNPGRFFSDSQLEPYSITLDDMKVVYETENPDAIGSPLDFTAEVTVTGAESGTQPARVKVNDPLRTHNTDVYLLGNGYAPTITVRNPQGEIVFTDSVPFLPQDAKLTSVGVVKVPDGLAEQIGLVGFFYPTQGELESGAYFSAYPDLEFPMLTLNVFAGDLGLDEGVPRSVYALDTTTLTQLTGRDTDLESIELRPGETGQLPNGLGSVTFEDARGEAATSDTFDGSVLRFASLDIHHDPARMWVLIFTVLAIAGLLASLMVARRRVWVKAIDTGEGLRIQVAGLARGDDPRLAETIEGISQRLSDELNSDQQPPTVR